MDSRDGGVFEEWVVLKVRAACMIGWMFVCLAAACSFEDHAKHCAQDSECSPGRCYEGFCIAARQDTSSSAQKGSDASATTGSSTNTGKGNQTAGKGGSSAKPPADSGIKDPKVDAGAGDCKDGAELPCLVNPDNKTAAEACNRGMQTCKDGEWSVCSGMPAPEPEQCNGRDDDCNGEVDDLVEVCYPQGQAGCTRSADGHWLCTGTCGTGTRTCRDGTLSDCEGATVPTEDICTPSGMVARNEDCDDLTDEGCDCRSGETHPCYSGREGTMGQGKCVAGQQACVNGALGACEGEVLDDPETCGNAKVDDDCNGVVDDVPLLGNSCTVSGAQGPCGSGTLACSGSSGPSCVSTAMPSAELCNSLDDDCNGRVDETFNLRRDAQNCGMCGQRCTSGQACCGSRCVSNANDNNHCGACGMRCPNNTRCSAGACVPTSMPMAGMPAGGAPPTAGMSGTSGGAGASGSGGRGGVSGTQCDPACATGLTCCGGTCIDLQKDPQHCGACQTACSFENSGCCDGKCTDFLDEKTCGGCTKDCSLLSTETVMCDCVKDSDGKISCTGPVLNLCLL